MQVTTEADEEEKDFLMPCGTAEEEQEAEIRLVEHLQQRLDIFEGFADVVFTTIRLSSMSSRLFDD